MSLHTCMTFFTEHNLVILPKNPLSCSMEEIQACNNVIEYGRFHFLLNCAL